MATQLEVGLFVDFENIRYGLLNNGNTEPDCQALMDKARKYGPVAVAFAYADFTQQPPVFQRKLEVAGITPRHVPSRGPSGPRNAGADMSMLMDIVDCLLDRPHVNTLVLMTGDSDFLRIAARARNRFGKQVVVSGVPGSVSRDLIDSADLYDPLGDESAQATATDALLDTDDDQETRLLQLVDWLARHRPYMTFGFIRSHALSPHHSIGMSEDRVTEILSGFKERGILMERQRAASDGRTLRTLQLNEHHAALQAARRCESPRFEGR